MIVDSFFLQTEEFLTVSWKLRYEISNKYSLCNIFFGMPFRLVHSIVTVLLTCELLIFVFGLYWFKKLCSGQPSRKEFICSLTLKIAPKSAKPVNVQSLSYLLLFHDKTVVINVGRTKTFTTNVENIDNM